ncbi:MAG TPA: BamA/TamA family outer membrane protein, partial [Allosphingosinicella sp.]|nr:BamA/TamA family outer membrane protein [Allosphingosinicella sp.]
FSSLERFLVNLAIEQRNFRGLGQILRASVNYSSYSKSVDLGFTEPFLFDRNIAVGFDLYRRDLNSFNFLGNDRATTYEQISTGGQIRVGVPLLENLNLALRYGISLDDITLSEELFFTDPDGTGPLPAACDPFKAGRYLCDVIGERTTSSVGYTLLWSTLNSSLRPTRGERLLLSQDFAGLGGSTRYLRTRASAIKFWNVFNNFIFSLSLEGGYIHSFEDGAADRDPLRLTDRFFLGNPQIRGFDIRGVGPRVQRRPYNVTERDPTTGRPLEFAISDDPNTITDDAIGGRAYYLGRAELEIPLGSGARDLGLRPSIFLDVGALWGVRRPQTLDVDPLSTLAQNECRAADGTVTLRFNPCQTGETTTRFALAPFREDFLGDSPSPRVSVGFGVNWNSPFGPFRIDIAKALITEPGDDTKLFTFNVGTAF